jgi:glyoxylase-like metal-dependent hydrolase (beta-lactamase superfamily II)
VRPIDGGTSVIGQTGYGAGVRRLPVRARWFEARPVGDGVTRIDEPFVDPPLRSNAWLVSGAERDALIDCGTGIGRLRPALDALRPMRRRPIAAIATHGHPDHIGSLYEFDERLCHRLEASMVTASDVAAPLVPEAYDDGDRRAMAEARFPPSDLTVTAVPREDFDPATFEISRAAPTRTVEDGDVVDLGSRILRVVHLPGHTHGSVAALEERTGLLFSGDTLFHAPVSPVEQADIEAHVASLQRLRELPVRIVHGGHGPSFGGAAVALRVDEDVARCETWSG